MGQGIETMYDVSGTVVAKQDPTTESSADIPSRKFMPSGALTWMTQMAKQRSRGGFIYATDIQKFVEMRQITRSAP